MRTIFSAVYRVIGYVMLLTAYTFFIYYLILPGLETLLLELFFPELSGSPEDTSRAIHAFHGGHDRLELIMAFIAAIDAVWARIERKQKSKPRDVWRKH